MRRNSSAASGNWRETCVTASIVPVLTSQMMSASLVGHAAAAEQINLLKQTDKTPSDVQAPASKDTMDGFRAANARTTPS